jgi:hypothetical protein
MKITLVKRGGLAGAIFHGRPPATMDINSLPPAAAEEFARLMQAAKDAPARKPPGSGVPGDVMSYTITAGEGAAATVLTQSDMTMSTEFADLLHWIESHLTGR